MIDKEYMLVLFTLTFYNIPDVSDLLEVGTLFTLKLVKNI